MGDEGGGSVAARLVQSICAGRLSQIGADMPLARYEGEMNDAAWPLS